MTILGIGPSLAIGGFGSLAFFIVLQVLFGITLSVSPSWERVLLVAGVVLCVLGVALWISSAAMVVRAFRAKKLVTGGAFRVTRNPLYSAFIVFVAPGIALITNNLLYLFVSIVMFAIFRSLIWREEEYLLKEFGEDYKRYAEKVPQIIPFIKT